MELVFSILSHAGSGLQISKHASNVTRGVGLVLASAFACGSPSVEQPPLSGGTSKNVGGGRSSPTASSVSSSTMWNGSGVAPKFSTTGTAALRSPAEEAARRRSNIRFQAVPSTRVQRASHFGVLFLQLGWEKYRKYIPWNRAGKRLTPPPESSGAAPPLPMATDSNGRSRSGRDAFEGRTKEEDPERDGTSWTSAVQDDAAPPHLPSSSSSPPDASPPSHSNQTISDKGHQRIVETLCRMRGAVLKLGQMLSIQNGATVPSHITALFAKVRDQAFAMPPSQLRATLAKEFHHEDWKAMMFVRVDEEPVAAASIGQVHWAELKGEYASPFPPPHRTSFSSASPRAALSPATTQKAEKGSATEDPAVGSEEEGIQKKKKQEKNKTASVEVAIKVQYPGVAKSIESDIHNLRTILKMGFLPPGMFVDQVLRELRGELLQECQYLTEAEKQIRYATLVDQHPTLSTFFHVPRVYLSLCTSQMLVTEYVRGVPIDQITNPELGVPKAFRSYAAEQLMTLTLTELFDWCFMQTDPNFSNFLFSVEENKVYLLDFGAARTYPASFVDDYLDVVAAAARQDREAVISKSIDLGFLTGREVKEMLDAHVESVFLLGKPFRDREHAYDFSLENIPAQVQKLVPTMLRLRLKPPPTPAYSLHRRLSGTILLCSRLQASAPCGKVFWEIYEQKKAAIAAAARASHTTS